jgi:hypothetical protein
VPVGSTGAPRVFSVVKNGNSPTGALTVTVSSPEFVITDDTCTGAGFTDFGYCSVSIALQPTSAGAKRATVTVTGTVGVSAVTTITGTAVAS